MDISYLPPGARGRFVEQKVRPWFQLLVWRSSHFVVPLKSDLDRKQPHLGGWFVTQKLKLSNSFWCD
jgi:hypothetical protein